MGADKIREVVSHGEALGPSRGLSNCPDMFSGCITSKPDFADRVRVLKAMSSIAEHPETSN